MAATPRSIREIDFNVDAPAPARHGLPLSVPLQIVVALLVQTSGIVYWASQQSAKLQAVIEAQADAKAGTYNQRDAVRDLALRDDRIAELGRRVEILERIIDGRRR